MEKPTCPYMVSGICYREHGCIYIPSFECLTKTELNKRIKLSKKQKFIKKGGKNNER